MFYNVGLWFISILCVFPYFAFSYRHTIIIDTDAGADDAMAILMILSRPDVNVEAITCVQGNTGIYNVDLNVLKTLAIAGRLDIPVYSGSNTGLVYSAKSDNFFGNDGFGDFEFFNPPSVKLLQKEHAAVALSERVRKRPGEITILCIGPLTNIAMASHINKDFFLQVKSIQILGGSYKDKGNIGPGIEFNIFADPDAAASFFTRLPSYTRTLLLPFEAVSEVAFSLSWRRNVLGKLNSKKMAFLNLAERVSLLNVTTHWTAFDPGLAAVFLHPDIVLSSKVGQPVVNTSTNRGAMHVQFGDGAVEIVTALNKVELKRILISTLS